MIKLPLRHENGCSSARDAAPVIPPFILQTNFYANFGREELPIPEARTLRDLIVPAHTSRKARLGSQALLSTPTTVSGNESLVPDGVRRGVLTLDRQGKWSLSEHRDRLSFRCRPKLKPTERRGEADIHRRVCSGCLLLFGSHALAEASSSATASGETFRRPSWSSGLVADRSGPPSMRPHGEKMRHLRLGAGDGGRNLGERSQGLPLQQSYSLGEPSHR